MSPIFSIFRDIEPVEPYAVIKRIPRFFHAPADGHCSDFAQPERPVVDFDDVVADYDALQLPAAVEATLPIRLSVRVGMLTDLRLRQFLKAPMPKARRCPAADVFEVRNETEA